MKKEIQFSKVKKGQHFEYGKKVDGEWKGVTTYKKNDDGKTASPVYGQEHHVYGFKPTDIVVVEVKA